MMRARYQSLLDYLRKINWMVLLFLVLVMDVKMIVKAAALVVLLLLNRKSITGKRIFHQRFLWFYMAMILLIIVNLLVSIRSVNASYSMVVLAAISGWLLCLAAGLLNSAFAEKIKTDELHATVSLFFVLNGMVTLLQLFWAMWDAGSINPYTYQGDHQKYFIGTGDLMTGISFDVSTTNALLNAFGVIYFLSRYRLAGVFFCMTSLLLTGSNFTNLLLGAVLLFMIFFQSTRNQKSVIIICFLLMAVFWIKVSPQNDRYATDLSGKIAGNKTKAQQKEIKRDQLIYVPDSVLDEEQRKQKFAILFIDSLKGSLIRQLKQGVLNASYVDTPQVKIRLPKDNIHTEPFQRRHDTSSFQRQLRAFALQNIPGFDQQSEAIRSTHAPGKWTAGRQTLSNLAAQPQYLLTGFGAGNFSSKLAMRATGLGMAGGYSSRYVYVSKRFLENHLMLYLVYFSRDKELHSLANSPNSAYDQLLSEYGLLGTGAFVFFYVGFFFKGRHRGSYSLPLLLLLLGALGVEYWFEQLSIVILFELLMLIDKKERAGYA